MSRPVAIYEKALPDAAWPELFRHASRCGYAAVELAVDESAERIARLAWTREQRADVAGAAADVGVSIATVTLSAHRATPLGSADPATRARSRAMLADADTTRDALDRLAAMDLGDREVTLAGGIGPGDLRHFAGRRFDVVAVGKAIARAADPARVTEALRRELDELEVRHGAPL